MNHLGFQNDNLAQNIFLSALNSNSLTVLSFTGGSVSKSILGLSFPQWKIIFSWPYLHPPLLIKVWRIWNSQSEWLPAVESLIQGLVKLVHELVPKIPYGQLPNPPNPPLKRRNPFMRNAEVMPRWKAMVCEISFCKYSTYNIAPKIRTAPRRLQKFLFCIYMSKLRFWP